MVTITLCPTVALPEAALDDATIASMAAALEDFVNHGPGPAYSQGAYRINAVPRGAAVPAAGDHQWLAHLDGHTDLPGAFGYHQIDAHGHPFSRTFVLTCGEHHADWFVSLSHEIVELMVNRYADLGVLASVDGATRVFLCEACDPVEASTVEHAFAGRTLRVANYVLPSYWRPGVAGPYDRGGLVKAPLQAAPGGRQRSFALAGVPPPGPLPSHDRSFTIPGSPHAAR